MLQAEQNLNNLSDAPSQSEDLLVKAGLSLPSTSEEDAPVVVSNIKPVSVPLAPSTPPSTPISKGKVGLGLLKQLREKQKQSSLNAQEVKALNDELLKQLLGEFMQKLESEEKDLVKTQLSLCEFSLEAENVIACMCSMHLQYNTLQSIRQELVGFIESKTGNTQIKIRITLNESLQDAPTTWVLSKNEYFEALSKEFPVIKALRDQLGLMVKAMYQLDVEELETKTEEKSDVSNLRPSIELDEEIFTDYDGLED